MQSLRSYKEVLWQNANADTHMCTAFHVHTYQNLAKNENEKYLYLSLLAESKKWSEVWLWHLDIKNIDFEYIQCLA